MPTRIRLLRRRAIGGAWLVGATSDLVASFVADELLLTFTPAASSINQQYRYRLAAGLFSEWVALPDSDEEFAPNVLYYFEIRNVDIAGRAGPPSNTSPASFTVDAVQTFISTPTSTSGTDAASHTFTTGDFGDITAARTWALIFWAQRASSAQSLLTATIDGVAASIVFNTALGVSRMGAIILEITTGGTKTVVLNWSGTIQKATIKCYKVTDLISTTPVFTSDSTMSSGVLSASANVLAGGILFGLVQNNAAVDWVWTTLTEDGDTVIESQQVSVASKAYAAAQTGLTITATQTGQGAGTNPGMFLLAMR